MKAIAMLLLLATAASAERAHVFFVPVANPNMAALADELQAANFSFIFISGPAGNKPGPASLTMPDSETKDPSAVIAAHVWADPSEQRDTLRNRIVLLAKKVRDGNANQAEKEELLWRLTMYLTKL